MSDVIKPEVVEDAKLADEPVEGADVAEELVAKRARKLQKNIEGFIVTITAVGGEEGEMKFDSSELPEKVKEALIPFGLSHKLGDSAAGRSGKDAEEAIKKVWEGMLKGEWTTRVAAEPKVAIKTVKDNLGKLDEAEAAKARELLASLGIVL